MGVPGTEVGGFSKPHWSPTPQDQRTPQQKSRDDALGHALGRQWRGYQPLNSEEK